MAVEAQGTQEAQGIGRLVAVQELDLRLRDLERELRDIPLRKEEEQARLAAHRQALEAARDKIKHAQAAIRQLDVETGSRREKIVKLRQQQLELKTNKEFQAMEGEIRAVERDIAGIEDRELTLMDDLETAKFEADESSRTLAAEEAEVSRDVSAWDERMRALETEIAGVRAAREQATQGVPADLLRNYERVLGRKTPALAPIEDGVCGGCHMKLPPYVLHDARRADGMVFCVFCGRLLHWPA
ncbi:MAG: hypothetical protein FJ225_12855 [Lentisphaerae bacterium]|nr:hypothetical protein [Lentisphaerota bacterium]